MSEAGSITVRVPLTIRRRPGRKTIVTPGSQHGDKVMPTRADPVLVKALARAFRYQRLLDDGRYASISEMATAERIERGYLGTLLRLTLLAPDVVEAILDGREPDGLALPGLIRPIPSAWDEQRATLESRGSRTPAVCGAHVENPVPADGPARIPAARASPAGFMGNAGSGT
jgi:hypothetical protein